MNKNTTTGIDLDAAQLDKLPRLYRFDRYHGACKLAEGIGVHAASMAEAIEKARDLARTQRMPTDGVEMQFVSNAPCARRCEICEAYELARRSTSASDAEALAGRTVSVDVSTCDDDAGHRIFAELTGEVGSDGATLLAIETSRNFESKASGSDGTAAASQPAATVVAVDPLRALHGDLGKIVWMGSDEGWDLAIEAVRKEIERRLATPPAPTRQPLADERTLEDLMHKHELIGVAGDNPNWEAKLIAFANDVLAQPIVSPAIEQQGGEQAKPVADAAIPETTDDARRFLVEWHRANWTHAPFFGNYISTELAGDFAFHLARWLARAAPTPAAEAVRDATDAARWREALKYVGGTYTGSGVRFTLRYLEPVADADVMRGSIAEHFTNAIDAAMSASQAPGGTA